jgi:acetylornithine deacetylase/succinyl-diaminopimelate desuccinylase-like protein
MDPLSEYFRSKRDSLFNEFAEFLSFKSVSTDPKYAEGCRECVQWLFDKVQVLGFSVQLLETGGKPCLFATRVGEKDLPTILYYGHYDVQPVDPVEKWDSPPFEATSRVVNGLDRVFARGAQDNKGQTFYVLKALEYLIENGQLKNSIKLLIEGEEECGSIGLARSLSGFQDLLGADILLVCDTGVLQLETPMITVGLRGMCGMEVRVKGAIKDLHSGVHGGVVKNPAYELARVLGALKDENGAVTLPGFYDNLEPLSAREMEHLKEFPITPELYQSMVGVLPNGGESGYSFAERRGIRPALDVVGMSSGYSGPGLKSIIPSEASAKVSFRLVPNQEPAKILELFRRRVEDELGSDFTLEFLSKESTGGALRVKLDSSAIVMASSVLEEVVGRAPLYCWEGASIPIIAELSKVSGAAPLMVGFGLEEDSIHAPNESFSWQQMELGFRFIVTFLGGN